MCELAEKLGLLLKAHHQQVVTVESCTGGGLAALITDIPGSSEWFDCGFVTYSNIAKINLVNVNADTLANHGAVSERTAREMAQGALSRSAAQLSISITGIAGPDGGTAEKPIGMVCFGLATAEQVKSYTEYFSGTRQQIRDAAIESALKALLTFLKARVDVLE